MILEATNTKVYDWSGDWLFERLHGNKAFIEKQRLWQERLNRRQLIDWLREQMPMFKAVPHANKVGFTIKGKKRDEFVAFCISNFGDMDINTEADAPTFVWKDLDFSIWSNNTRSYLYIELKY